MSTASISAGLLMVRWGTDGAEYLLAHPGGPYFARKDEGVWTLPKGLVDPNEDWLEAAKREFREETGFEPKADVFVSLGQVRQRSGKVVHAWAFAGDCDPTTLRSNEFELEWPPRSGKRHLFPEIDRAAFFGLAEARAKILAAQEPFLERAAHPDAIKALFGGPRGPRPA